MSLQSLGLAQKDINENVLIQIQKTVPSVMNLSLCLFLTWTIVSGFNTEIVLLNYVIIINLA
jgi:hypothetical protein